MLNIAMPINTMMRIENKEIIFNALSGIASFNDSGQGISFIRTPRNVAFYLVVTTFYQNTVPAVLRHWKWAWSEG